MSIIELEERWRRQPPPTAVALEVSRLWRGRALFVHVASKPTEIVGRKRLLNLGTALQTTSVGASGLVLPSNSTGCYEIQTPRIPSSVVGTAMIFKGSFPSGITPLITFGEVASFGGFFRMGFDPAVGAIIAAFRGRSAGGVTSRNSTIGGARVDVCVVAHIASTTVIDIYQDGFLVNNAMTATAGVDNLLWTTACLFGARRNTTTYAGSGGQMALGAAVERATSEEALALSRDPWQLIEPRRIWVPVAAAGGPPTLAAITASNITTTGARLTVTV